MNDNAKYWIWFQQSMGYASTKVNTVRRFFKSMEEFYNVGKKEWLLCGCFTVRELKNLYENTLEDAENIMERCERLGYKILTPDDEKYPKQLEEIYNPPSVLYVDGNIPDTDKTLSIGVVGTRSATLSGKKTAYSISYDLAKSGVIIVSGGALGIDSSAHKGALRANKANICVLGCGINYNYLMTNAQLRHSIAKTGAIISEYPPDTPPSKYSFPKRNRIISALSQGVLVVEAGIKSGALITAKIALAQDKDIFAVPGDVNNIFAQGANNLIKEGAKPVINANDILEEYNYRYSLEIGKTTSPNEINDKILEEIPYRKRKTKSLNEFILEKEKSNEIKKNKSNNEENEQKLQSENKKSKKEALTYISKNARIIYDIICENPTTLNDIIEKSNITASEVLVAITELEIYSLITKNEAEGKYNLF